MGRGPGHSPNWGGDRRSQTARVSTISRTPARPRRAEQLALPGMAADNAFNLNNLRLPHGVRRPGQKRDAKFSPFKLPDFPPEAVPRERGDLLAMDSVPATGWANSAWLSGTALNTWAEEGLLFPGYAYLSQLAQRTEYRLITETIADDANRGEWIEYDVVTRSEREKQERDAEGWDPDQKKKRLAGAGKLDKVKKIKDAMLQLRARDVMHELSTHDGWFGRGHLFFDFGEDLDAVPGGKAAQSLALPVGDGRGEVSRELIRGSKLLALRAVEPIWAYPQSYQSGQPLRSDFYRPQHWYVMGQQVHCSRLIPFVTRPVPDILKPSYAFGGVSNSQLAQPYVDIWLATRQSVADIVHSFSTFVLSTNLMSLTTPGGQGAGGIMNRAALWNWLRDNQNLLLIDKDKEDFKNVSAPLGTLDSLQQQALEHICTSVRLPLIKFTGISPSGLNATSEFEIEVYDDTINAYQNRHERPLVQTVVNFVQLMLFGEVDPDITFDFAPLRQMGIKDKAEKQKNDAERDTKFIDSGVLRPEEVRARVANDPDLPYGDIDPDDPPDLEEEEQQGLEPEGGRPQPQAGEGGGGAQEGAGPVPEDADPFALDAGEWKEGDHPRSSDGKFGAGGGGSPGGKERQKLVMPQYGLTRSPSSNHQPAPRKPMEKTSGDPKSAESLVSFEPGKDHAVEAVGGVPFKSWKPPEDWSTVEGQADVGEPPPPDLPKGMTLSSGVIIREPDGRVWLTRPTEGFGGYEQTFPKGGVEPGLPMQANAIKEAYEETGLHVRITGFAGDYEGDTTISRYYVAERVGGDPRDAGWESEGVILSPPGRLDELLNRKRDKAIAVTLAQDADFNESDHPRDQSGKFSKGGGGSVGASPLSSKNLTKVGEQKGSNPGGVYKDKATGKEFYVKTLKSKSRAANETLAANLFKMAGGNTLTYHQVEQDNPALEGKHVATLMAKPDKANLSKLNEQEKKQAQKDFVANAWLANWDAAGTGGDNVGVVDGKVTTLDFGGSLAYRAQGEPKGGAFGNDVPELASMKNPQVSPDNAKLYGSMTAKQTVESAKQVTDLMNDQIIDAVKDAGGSWHLAEKLIARKNYIADQYNLPTDKSAWDDQKHPRNPDGTFKEGPSEVEIPDAGAAEKKPLATFKGENGMEANVFQNEDGKNFNVALKDTESGETLPTFFVGPSLEWAQEKAKGLLKDPQAAPEKTEEQPMSTSLAPYAAEAPGKAKKTAFGGLWKAPKPGQSESINFNDNVAHVLANQTNAGTTYQAMLGFMVKNVDAHGAGEMYKQALKDKLADSFAKSAGKLMAAGKTDDAGKIVKMMATKLGVPAQTIAALLLKHAPATDALNAAKAVASQPDKPAPKAAETKKAEPAKNFPAPTPAEIEKAKKSAKLQPQYVPAIAAAVSEEAKKLGQKMLDEFNAKYEGLTLTDAPQLVDKVNAFKNIGAAVEQADAGAKQKQAEQQKEKDKKQAEELKKAEASSAEVNAKYMAELGISKTEANAFNALAKIHGESNSASLVEKFKGYQKKAESLGLPISGFEYAMIRAYINGAYIEMNAALRSGNALTQEQHVYTWTMNKAIDKLPKFTGNLMRGTNLTPAQIAEYKPGHVVSEKAFTSTGDGFKFSGNVHYKIKATGKRGGDFSQTANKHEREVIFKANTHFLVHKVESKGGTTYIEMEEVESHG